MNRRSYLPADPVPLLLDCPVPGVAFFTRRDLLGETAPSPDTVRDMPEPRKILKKQNPDGSWGKADKKPNIYPPDRARLIETFKQYRILVERYGLDNGQPEIAAASEFLFSFQADEGDIRGFIGNQYATYYTGYVLSLLIKAGYESDPRVEKGMRWLLAIRQDDGGWTVPILTIDYDRRTLLKLTSAYMEAVPPDRTQPFSHNWTDMVLRAFAAHPAYRRSAEAVAAGKLLKSSFFRKDNYTSYQAARYWTRFVFWWPNLLTALESLALLGFTREDPDIKKGLAWFRDNQQPDGLWAPESGREVKEKDAGERCWLGLAICRMLQRFVAR